MASQLRGTTEPIVQVDGSLTRGHRPEVIVANPGGDVSLTSWNQGAAGTDPWPVLAEENGTAWTSAFGVAGAPVTSADMSSAAVAVTDAPAAGEKLVIDEILASAAANMLLTFTCETTNAVIAHVRLAANATVHVAFRDKLKLATADKKLKCQASASGAVEILVGAHSEA